MFTRQITKEETQGLKGILSILVLLCHLRSYIGFVDSNSILSSVFVAFGYVPVAIFFFLSGYGLSVQYFRKKDYMASFFRKRVLGTYIKYVFIILCYAALFLLVKMLKPQLLLQSFLFGGTIVVNGWYFQAIILLYIIFGIIYKLKLNENIKIILLFVGMLLYILLSVFVCEGNHWYQSVLCFPLGFLYNYIHISLPKNENANKKANLIISICKIIVGVSLLILKLFVNIPNVLNTILLPVAVVIFVTGMNELKLLRPCNNAVCKFLGTVSLEIYAVHGAMITIFRSGYLYIKNDILFLIVVLAASIICSIALNFVFKFIDKIVKNIGEKKWKTAQ